MSTFGDISSLSVEAPVHVTDSYLDRILTSKRRRAVEAAKQIVFFGNSIKIETDWQGQGSDHAVYLGGGGVDKGP